MVNPSSKVALMRYISEEWTKESTFCQLPQTIVLYAGGTFKDRETSVCISHNGVSSISELESNQEEADTRIFLHVAFSAQNGTERVVICTPDTYILTLCIYLFSNRSRV